MASMQHDFIHPRQLDDVKAIRDAIKSFTIHMKRMMLLMKDLGTTLEQVSHSFDALTSLSFSDDGVKQYVHHFSEEVLYMMEGAAFQNYNKLVHEEVLAPVEQLRTSVKETEKAAKKEKSDFDRYKKAKLKVDAQEKSYAAKSRSLDTSKSYPASVQKRDDSLLRLQKSKDEFEVKFVGLVNEVEKVTATTLKRYLDLNAGYMTSVVDALTKTDATVEEAVALYREEQRQQRQHAIQQRCAEVDTELITPYASQGYRLCPTNTNRTVAAAGGSGVGRNGDHGSSSSSPQKPSPQQSPQSGAAAAAATSCSPNAAPAAEQRMLSNSSAASFSVAKQTLAAPATKGPPAAMMAATAAAPAPATAPPAQWGGGATQRGAFTVTSTSHASPATPAVVATPNVKADNDTSHLIDDVDDEDVEEEDFGSVSQVGTAGKVAPPLYNFSRGPLSQVSSVPPPSGYVATQNANLTNDFLRKMESQSLTASEVCAARPSQP
jgi:hypothetical protein